MSSESGPGSEKGFQADRAIDVHRSEVPEQPAERELHRLVGIELLAQQVDVARRKLDIAANAAPLGLPVDVLVSSDRDPAGTELFEAFYEQVGLSDARREAVEEPIVDDNGRKLGSECRLPSIHGLTLVELTTFDMQPFGGDAFRRLQTTRPLEADQTA